MVTLRCFIEKTRHREGAHVEATPALAPGASSLFEESNCSLLGGCFVGQDHLSCNARLRFLFQTFTGSCKIKRLPAEGVLSKLMSPPWATRISRAMLNPNPIPSTMRRP